MSVTDIIYQACPYCGLQASITHFVSWKRGDKRGLVGKTADNLLILLCPECEGKIQFDTLENEFAKFLPTDADRHRS
jgi:rubredoxin